MEPYKDGDQSEGPSEAKKPRFDAMAYRANRESDSDDTYTSTDESDLTNVTSESESEVTEEMCEVENEMNDAPYRLTAHSLDEPEVDNEVFLEPIPAEQEESLLGNSNNEQRDPAWTGAPVHVKRLNILSPIVLDVHMNKDKCGVIKIEKEEDVIIILSPQVDLNHKLGLNPGSYIIHHQIPKASTDSHTPQPGEAGPSNHPPAFACFVGWMTVNCPCNSSFGSWEDLEEMEFPEEAAEDEEETDEADENEDDGEDNSEDDSDDDVVYLSSCTPDNSCPLCSMQLPDLADWNLPRELPILEIPETDSEAEESDEAEGLEILEARAERAETGEDGQVNGDAKPIPEAVADNLHPRSLEAGEDNDNYDMIPSSDTPALANASRPASAGRVVRRK